MSDGAVAILSLMIGVGLIPFICWQLKTGNFIDPIFSRYTPTSLRRTLLWITSAIYVGFSLMLIVGGMEYLRAG